MYIASTAPNGFRDRLPILLPAGCVVPAAAGPLVIDDGQFIGEGRHVGRRPLGTGIAGTPTFNYGACGSVVGLSGAPFYLGASRVSQGTAGGNGGQGPAGVNGGSGAHGLTITRDWRRP